MKLLVFCTAILAISSLTKAGVVKRDVICNGGNCNRNCQVNCNNNVCEERCENRQICNTCPNNDCNQCVQNCDRGSCDVGIQNGGRQNWNNRHSGSSGSKSDSVGGSNVNYNSKQSSENPHTNNLNINLKNTINNVNNISNPIEISNTNNFTYSGVSQSKSDTTSSGGGGGWFGGFPQYRREPEPRPEPQRECCGDYCNRQPIILPPYIPPPPPCQIAPQPFCTYRPQHQFVVSECAPCFYCAGQYNPSYCSQQPSCTSRCRERQCYGQPCYPQLRQTCNGKVVEEKEIETNVDKKNKEVKEVKEDKEVKEVEEVKEDKA